MHLNSPCQEVGFISPFVVIVPTYLGVTTVVAPGLMLDNFQPIPDADSLPFYPLVLKLVMCMSAKLGMASALATFIGQDKTDSVQIYAQLPVSHAR